MNTALKWFVYGWSCLAVLINAASIAMVFAVNGAGPGWAIVSETWNPFNVWNVVAEIVLFSPAIAANHWLQRRLTRL